MADSESQETPPENEAGKATQDNATNAPDTKANETDSTATGTEASDPVCTPDFQDLKPGQSGSGGPAEMNRFYEVQVTVAAELGRTSVPIQDLLSLTEGSVFELNRSISSPIELIAQGIPLGNGEVVVVDDTFAVRIKEIYASS